jgi:hypothetical protein
MDHARAQLRRSAFHIVQTLLERTGEKTVSDRWYSVEINGKPFVLGPITRRMADDCGIDKDIGFFLYSRDENEVYAEFLDFERAMLFVETTGAKLEAIADD